MIKFYLILKYCETTAFVVVFLFNFESMEGNEIYVFIGEESCFPLGIFTTLENAEGWINKYSVSGVLSKYPLDIGLYDWAIKEGFLTVKNEYQKEPKFIQKFTCASMEHFHFENGKLQIY